MEEHEHVWYFSPEALPSTETMDQAESADSPEALEAMGLTDMAAKARAREEAPKPPARCLFVELSDKEYELYCWYLPRRKPLANMEVPEGKVRYALQHIANQPDPPFEHIEAQLPDDSDNTVLLIGTANERHFAIANWGEKLPSLHKLQKAKRKADKSQASTVRNESRPAANTTSSRRKNANDPYEVSEGEVLLRLIGVMTPVGVGAYAATMVMHDTLSFWPFAAILTVTAAIGIYGSYRFLEEMGGCFILLICVIGWLFGIIAGVAYPGSVAAATPRQEEITVCDIYQPAAARAQVPLPTFEWSVRLSDGRTRRLLPGDYDGISTPVSSRSVAESMRGNRTLATVVGSEPNDMEIIGGRTLGPGECHT